MKSAHKFILILALSLFVSSSLVSAWQLPAEYDYSPWKSASSFGTTSVTVTTTTTTTTTVNVNSASQNDNYQKNYGSNYKQNSNDYRAGFYISKSTPYKVYYSSQIVPEKDVRSCLKYYYPKDCGVGYSEWKNKPIYEYEDYGPDEYGKPYYYQPVYDHRLNTYTASSGYHPGDFSSSNWHQSFFNSNSNPYY